MGFLLLVGEEVVSALVVARLVGVVVQVLEVYLGADSLVSLVLSLGCFQRTF